MLLLSALCTSCASAPSPIQVTRPTNVPDMKSPDAFECEQDEDFGSVGLKCGDQDVWVSGVAYPGDPADADYERSVKSTVRWRKSSGFTFVREGKPLTFVVNGQPRLYKRIIFEKDQRLSTVFTGWSWLGGEHRSIQCGFVGSVTIKTAQAFCPSMLSRVASYAHARRPSSVTVHGQRVDIPADCALGDRYIECVSRTRRLSIMWEETRHSSTVDKLLRFLKQDIKALRDKRGWAVTMAQQKACTFGDASARCFDFRLHREGQYTSRFLINDKVNDRYMHLACTVNTVNAPTTDLPDLCAAFFNFQAIPLTSPVQ